MHNLNIKWNNKSCLQRSEKFAIINKTNNSHLYVPFFLSFFMFFEKCETKSLEFSFLQTKISLGTSLIGTSIVAFEIINAERNICIFETCFCIAIKRLTKYYSAHTYMQKMTTIIIENFALSKFKRIVNLIEDALLLLK